MTSPDPSRAQEPAASPTPAEAIAWLEAHLPDLGRSCDGNIRIVIERHIVGDAKTLMGAVAQCIAAIGDTPITWKTISEIAWRAHQARALEGGK